jgi:hypothetical protein
MKVTLTHIGAIALGRLLAIWSFVIGLISLVVWGVVSLVMAVIGIASGTNIVAALISLGISLVLGVVGLFVFAIAMFVFGFITATVYNIILGIGGGIDVDFRERA